MKSIMEEASSVSKAIDQAWNRAGKPAEFTIKVLETPERNIFGLTVKSAKIALFFDEQKIVTKFVKPVEKAPLPQKNEPTPPPAPVPVAAPYQNQKRKEAAPALGMQPSQWNEEMIQFTKDWIQHVFQLMGMPQIDFTTSTSSNGLMFRFKNSIMGNEFKDRLLFSSFAHLILTMLRQKYKKAFKHLKIILLTD